MTLPETLEVGRGACQVPRAGVPSIRVARVTRGPGRPSHTALAGEVCVIGDHHRLLILPFQAVRQQTERSVTDIKARQCGEGS